MDGERYVKAVMGDCRELAMMNRQLIVDEGHPNRMSVDELTVRMMGFLDGIYTAYLVRTGGVTAGYCLYRHEPDHVHIRQLFVKAEFRRGGVGKRMVGWLRAQVWPGRDTVMEVLSGNRRGVAFWSALGFTEQSVTMRLAGAPQVNGDG